MNKYQEALEILCTYADGNPSSSGEFVGEMLQEANDTLQKLVSKATPKKLVDMSKEPHDTIGVCPNCRTWCYMEHHNEYCGECGQALDWSE